MRLPHIHGRADVVRNIMHSSTVLGEGNDDHVHELTVRHTQAMWREKYQQTLRISDALALALALALSQLIRFGLGDGFLLLESISFRIGWSVSFSDWVGGPGWNLMTPAV